MPNILVINTNVSWNKGSAAQVVSVVCSLSKFVPEVAFSLLSYCAELDQKLCSRYGISVVGYAGRRYHKHRVMLLLYSIRVLFSVLYCALCSLLRAVGLNTNDVTRFDKYAKAYAEADLILDLSGDSFSDWKNRAIMNMIAVLPALLLKKPVVFFSQSIGPFNYCSLPMAKFCLNKASLVVIREDVTKHYLERMGINDRRLCLAADCAFLLETAPSVRVLEILNECGISGGELPLIGINVSVFMTQHTFALSAKDYLSFMSRLVDYIVENKNAHVVLIPHVIAPRELGHDDRYAIREVQRLVRNKRRVTVIEDDYDPRELKGIIGQCELFIGCRMHSNIAALSQGIPTIAIGWSHKYYGIMKRFGMEEYVCDLSTMSYEELKVKVDTLFSMRKEIKNQLTSKAEDEKRSALGAVKLVSNLLSSC